MPFPSFWERPPKLAKRWTRQLSRDLAYRGIYLLAKGILFLGAERSSRWAGKIARIVARFQMRDRAVALKNLEDCLGSTTTPEERHQILTQMFENVGLAAAETIWMSHWGELTDYLEFEVEGIEHLEEALARGKGVICPNGHFGNWEVMSGFVAQQGYPGNIVTRKLKDPRLDAWLNQVRTNLGIGLVRRGRMPIQLLRVLRSGGILGIMIDLDTRSGHGIFVDFFGRPAYTQTGPFLLARKTGASIVPALCYREGINRLRFHFGPAWQVAETEDSERDIREATERATQYLEERIRERPEQWT
ncbi:MAG: lysophospholipid acyltransferase family protein, partial [Candidatus Omnitrophica bacterium]|nr:lysophospholipid acyltransferase family protein [Candidatus Omnitrophota bacterium]